MLDILYEHGELYLTGGQYEPQRLSWEEVQALAGPDTVGLPIGYGDQQQDPALECGRESIGFLDCGGVGGSPAAAAAAAAAALKGGGLLAHCRGVLEVAAGRYEEQQREVTNRLPLMLLPMPAAAAAGAECCAPASDVSAAAAAQPAAHRPVVTRKSVILSAVLGNDGLSN